MDGPQQRRVGVLLSHVAGSSQQSPQLGVLSQNVASSPQLLLKGKVMSCLPLHVLSCILQVTHVVSMECICSVFLVVLGLFSASKYLAVKCGLTVLPSRWPSSPGLDKVWEPQQQNSLLSRVLGLW